MTDTNHSKHLGAGAGWNWFATAVQAVRLNASRLFLIILFYSVVVGFLMVLPIVGSLFAALFMPFGSVLLGHSVRDVLNKKVPGLSLMTEAWSNPKVRYNLFASGLFYAFLLITVQAVYGILSEPYAATWQVNADNRLVWDSVFANFPWMPLIVAGAIYIPGLMATWFSPLLCADKNMTWGKSLFYSFFGCLRNILPILVLGIVLAVSIATIFYLAGEAIVLLGLTSVSMYVYVPLSCIVLTVLYSTYWPMYDDLFGATHKDAS